jgi:glycosyltransferase involved in cell wall biosynthesis
VIAHSHAAAREIAEDLAIPPERIDVVSHGPGSRPDVQARPEDELRRGLGIGNGPIVLAVSALAAHKNVGALVDAMPVIRNAVPDATLVVPGNPTRYGDELAARAWALGVADAVVFPGWVDSADLEGLYRAAACFVFPSFREGFGLPVLEAMARGVPVACSNASAVPEVAGDAALYFSPDHPDQIADAVTRVLRDPELAHRLSERGRERAGLFTWAKAAEDTLAVYERARRGS